MMFNKRKIVINGVYMYNLQPIDLTESVNEQEKYLISHKSIIERCIINAISATYSITDNHPIGARGTTFYNELISGLRDQFLSEGFERLCVNNIELTANKDLGIAFYFSRGDDQTGISEGFPRSLRKKGKVTQQILGLRKHSVVSLELFPDLNPKSDTEITIWAITIFADFKNEHYSAELGIPLSVNRKGFIDSFSHRIMLDINRINPTPIINKPIEFTEDFDINIIPNEQSAA